MPAYFNICVIKLVCSDISNSKLTELLGSYTNWPKPPTVKFHSGFTGVNKEFTVTRF